MFEDQRETQTEIETGNIQQDIGQRKFYEKVSTVNKLF